MRFVVLGTSSMMGSWVLLGMIGVLICDGGTGFEGE